MEERRFQSGDAVIEEGAAGDFFYVTGSGELEVRVAPTSFSFRNPQRFTFLLSSATLSEDPMCSAPSVPCFSSPRRVSGFPV